MAIVCEFWIYLALKMYKKYHKTNNFPKDGINISIQHLLSSAQKDFLSSKCTAPARLDKYVFLWNNEEVKTQGTLDADFMGLPSNLYP